MSQNQYSRAQDNIVSAFMKRAPAVVASIHDYKQLSKTLYKVIATVSTDKCDTDQLRLALAASVGNEFSVVESSFRTVTGAGVPAVVGFVRANRASMDYETAKAQGFREVAKNIFMSKEDESLWELNTVGDVKTVVRKTSDDLDSVMASFRERSFNVPQLSQIEVGAVAPRMEYAAWVSTESESVRHGFVVGFVEVEGKEMMEVMCSDKSTEQIMPDQIIESAFVGNEFTEIAADQKWDLPADVDMKTYYGLLYGYSPEYVKLLDAQIDGHAAG